MLKLDQYHAGPIKELFRGKLSQLYESFDALSKTIASTSDFASNSQAIARQQHPSRDLARFVLEKSDDM